RDRDAGGWTDDNRIDRLIDRDRIWAAKRAVLHAVYAEFVRSSGERRAAFDAFVIRQGPALRDFATWCALAEHYGTNWREWPAEFRHPRSAAVTEFRAAHPREVEFHAWLQWVVADQFREAHRVARDVGMPIGILHDLAVGVDPDGADAWADADVLARGVTLGAPADMYNQQGQRWNLAAWHPDRLAERDFLPLRETIRPWLEIGGGLRIDHVLGFFRQWWVVDGAAAADGAYLRLDPEALLGVVLIEAARTESLVIGEDLGVVPPGVREFLSQRGILGTSILWFERSPAGAPLPASEWRRDCLATVTTHDLPPTFGYLTGVHVDLRARLGLLQRDAAEERAHDEADRLAWLAALADAGLLDSAVVAAVAADDGRPWSERIEPYLPAVTSALHAYLGRTPALLRGVYLPDVVGDRRPVNQPGTSDQYPNWCIRMSDADGSVVLVEDLREQFTERARELTRLIAGGPESASVRASTTSPTDISVDISDRAGSGEGRA
ncbi:MAG: 4-alpha-glucanotransferase, partial [Acidothermus sp.]|nr:4-alpha-glucanotransferase [Acidothermus sp.]